MAQGIYETRIVTFIDILGFSTLVKASSEDLAIQDRLSKFYKALKGFTEDLKAVDSTCRISSFSDSIILTASFNQSVHQFDEQQRVRFQSILIKICHYITLIHHHLELAVRGAVTVGDVVHTTDDGDIIFGPAFTDAVESEKKAHFPRVILSEKLLKLLGIEQYTKDNMLLGIKKDIDNQYFIDHLSLAAKQSDNELKWEQLARTYSVTLQMIQESKKDPRITSKALWYAAYYNQFGKSQYPETYEEIELY